MGLIRVVLADDHPSILARVREILGHDFEVVAAVANGQQALEEVTRLDPDVLVIDISMPVLDGLQAVTRLHAAKCRTKVVFLTVHEDPDFVSAALAAGASGYVTKSRVATELVPAIREALEGRTFVSQSIPA